MPTQRFSIPTVPPLAASPLASTANEAARPGSAVASRSQDISVVNLAARQRMLSQRLILQILLAARGDRSRLDEARRTLQLFSESHQRLTSASKALPPAEAQRIDTTYQGPAGVGPVIDAFVHRVREAMDGIAQERASAPEAIDRLIGQTDRILAALDMATMAFDEITRARSEAMVKELVSIVGDIQGVAKEAKIVSFNAQVIAARAGQQGREFAVVANVLSNITDVIDRLTRKAAVLAEQRHTIAA
ncbi:type IV pili methyl-accepting chemotaxis transducer N-terminal domain-containing protein [Hylemonella gracilis]|uniref:Methyl-accepting chemotaxis protein n=1 Tax=Hylemonella gracilis ATCC 19624 TaxID=887062 RepID=F3KRR9_9BURK|nr:type IV pili methyl-accepting chemotaxis transducer N-terminal domain-containing protein [Hylemonella gracilis]EGI77520.1 methyl-accepting chemotaxis protein [Hylemonella gracilis ATCC 19624]